MAGTARAVRQPEVAPPAGPPRSAAGLRGAGTWLLLLAGALAIAVPVITTLDVDVPVRFPLSIAFAVLVPGAPVAALLRFRSPAVALAVTVAGSVSALLLVSTAQLVTGLWDPAVTTAVLGGTGLVLTPAALRHPVPLTGGRARHRLLTAAALAGALALWRVATARAELADLGATGIAGVVGPEYWAAVVLVVLVAAWHLRWADPDPLAMAATAVVLVTVLHGFLNAADSAAALPTGWLHVGFVDHISDNGAVATAYDARFSWPGFFAAAAVLVTAADLGSAAPLQPLTHVFYNVAAVPALYAIGRALTRDPRLAWLGVVLHLCFVWYSQDYLSPQATGYLLYLAVLAVLLDAAPAPRAVPLAGQLTRLRTAWRDVPPRQAAVTAGLAVSREMTLLAICAALVVSHQLTPVTLVGALLVLTVAGLTRARGLWLAVGLVFLAWFSFGATDFWLGNLDVVFGDLGDVGSTFGSSVGDRLEGNPTYALMQRTRLLWSATALGLGLLGALLLARTTWFWGAAGLALAPFGLVVVQSYGGEVALRAFLYAGPVLAPLAALAVGWLLARLPGALRSPALGCLLLVAAVLLVATRGANAGFERVTREQLEVARTMTAAVPAGSTVVTLGDAGPLGFDRLVEVERRSIGPDECEVDLVVCVLEERPDYLFVTRTQDVLGQLRFGLPAGWTRRLTDELVAGRLYVRLQDRPGAEVLALRPAPPRYCPC